MARNTIGKLSVLLTANTSRFQRQMKSARETIGRVANQASRLALAAGGLGLAAGAGFAAFGIKAIGAASDAEEALSRFDAVFGAQADLAGRRADELANRVGRSRVEIKDSLASFQGFFKGLGFGSERAADMSQQLQALAIDFGSFNNLSDEEAAGRFISALSGSSEVLDRFGVNIKAAAINQELLAQGINKTSATATEQEKALARIAIITRSLGSQGAIGDAERTAGSYANMLRRAGAAAGDLSVKIGSGLLPVAKKAIGVFLGLVGGIDEAIGEAGKFQSQIDSVLSDAARGVRNYSLDFVEGIDAIRTAYRGLKREIAQTINSLVRGTSRITRGVLGQVGKIDGLGGVTTGLDGVLRATEIASKISDSAADAGFQESNLAAKLAELFNRRDRSIGGGGAGVPSPAPTKDNQEDIERAIGDLTDAVETQTEVFRDKLGSLSGGEVNHQLLRVLDRIALGTSGRGPATPVVGLGSSVRLA